MSERRAALCVVVASLLLAAPTLFLRYLPATDLPQYLVASTILQHLREPQWDYEPYYDTAWSGSLSWLPYALMRGLASVLPLEAALRVVLCAALALQPIGVMAMLGALGKPRLYALLTFPLVYSSQFFWGLLASLLSLGLALCACAFVLLPERSLRQELALCGLGIAVAFTHVYGLAVLLTIAWLWLGRAARSHRRQRWPWSLWPAALLGLPWLWFAINADAISFSANLTLTQRLFLVSESLLGGYAGPYEALLLLALIAALALLLWPVVPRSVEDWVAAPAEERTLYVLLALALFGYLVLPLNLPSAMLIHPRVGVLVLLLAPLLLPAAALRERSRLAHSLPLLIGAGAIVLSCVQLCRFDAEARDFDAVAAAVRPRGSIMALMFDDRGQVAGTRPYLQFGAYLQARRGGYLGGDFFGSAWSIPIRLKPASSRPPSVPGFPLALGLSLTSPELDAYDELIIRGLGPRELVGIGGFHHTLIRQQGSWSLYRPTPRP